ncbi:hypothetical protein DL89DRAFT_294466 [Linderina pennispora]|uniref:Zinc finger PHD-type domain-containing protein n=1 Tax=Linderina pennispora TaxID=61395 RepID=A0A1Y1W310_9FUNG|nr:uncharacterized protein DL89DRAFT_294466 [Linderina pennispora]ORX67929.1 hypothetical protein DL89DRAFT_294466 [Linderina pennispora]
MDLYGQLLGLSADTYGSAVPPPQVHGSIGGVPESMAAVDGTSTPDVDESGGAEHPFQAQFDELAHLIASPPPVSMDHGQGLLTAGQAFSQNTDNCVCAENGGELNSDPMAPVIQCDSCCDYYHPECVQLPIVDARIIRFHQLSRQAGVIVDIPEFVPRGPKSYMCPGCCVNSGMPYAYGEIEHRLFYDLPHIGRSGMVKYLAAAILANRSEGFIHDPKWVDECERLLSID